MVNTVLVIEDNVANMKLVSLLLNKAGYLVLQADNATDGIALARQHHPNLILMDIQLPGIDGLAATRILKADPATCDIRIVALTAFAMRGDEETIRAAGCDGYIPKPIQYQTFLADLAQMFAVPEITRSVVDVHGDVPESPYRG